MIGSMAISSFGSSFRSYYTAESFTIIVCCVHNDNSNIIQEESLLGKQHLFITIDCATYIVCFIFVQKIENESSRFEYPQSLHIYFSEERILEVTGVTQR